MAEDDKKSDIKDRLSDSKKQEVKETDRKKLFFQHIEYIKNKNEEIKKERDILISQNIEALNKIQQKIKSESISEKNKKNDSEQSDKLKKIKNKQDKLYKLSSTVNNKVSLLRKATTSFINTIFNINLDKVINVCEKLSLLMIRGVGWFLDNTLGRMFKFFGFKGNILSSFITKMATSAWDLIKWVYDFAKKTISFIWDKMVMLAKVGWKILSTAWEILSTPLNIVYDIFKEIVLNIITSPIGFLAMSIGFVLLLRYAISTWWPKIKDFIIGIGTSIWDWVTTSIANIFFKGNTSEMTKWFSDKKVAVYNWLSNTWKWFISKYDEYIGSKIGLDSQTIINYFNSNDNIFMKIWNGAISIITSLYDGGLLEEIKMIWNVMKDVYYAFDYYVLGGAYSPEEKNQRESLIADNEYRLNLFYASAINSYAKSLLEQNLIETYLQNTNLEDSKLKSLLKNSGNTILENIKKSNLISGEFGEERTKEILEMINPNIVNESISTILNNKQNITREDLPNINKTIQATKIQLSQLSEISKETDIDKMNYLLNAYNEKTEKDFLEEIKIYAKLNDTVISGYVGKISDRELKNFALIENINEKGKLSFAAIESTLIELTNMNKFLEKELENKYGKKIKSKSEIIAIIKKDKPDLSPDEIEKLADEMLIGLLNSVTISKQAKGSVVRGIMPVIVGEGNSPEMIIPINQDGLEFVKKSMTDVIEKVETDVKDESQQTPNQNIIRKATKMLPKKDIKIYDMKNISNSLVAIG